MIRTNCTYLSKNIKINNEKSTMKPDASKPMSNSRPVAEGMEAEAPVVC